MRKGISVLLGEDPRNTSVVDKFGVLCVSVREAYPPWGTVVGVSVKGYLKELIMDLGNIGRDGLSETLF